MSKSVRLTAEGGKMRQRDDRRKEGKRNDRREGQTQKGR